MKLSNIFFIVCLIFIFTGGMYVGSVLQFNRDAEILNSYEANETIQPQRCIPCDCVTKLHPVLTEIPQKEPLKVRTIKIKPNNSC